MEEQGGGSGKSELVVPADSQPFMWKEDKSAVEIRTETRLPHPVLGDHPRGAGGEDDSLCLFSN